MAPHTESIGSKLNTPILAEGVKFIETLFQLVEVDEQTKDILKTTRHVTLNLRNVRHLRLINADRLSVRDLAWIDGIINDTQDALGGLARLVERARVEKDNRSYIGFRNRVRWVAHYRPKVEDKHAKLIMCHQSLMSVFPFVFESKSGLTSVAEDTRESVKASSPDTGKWLDWQDQRNRRRSNSSLRGCISIRRRPSSSSGSTTTTTASLASSNSSVSGSNRSPELPSSRKSYNPAYSGCQFGFGTDLDNNDNSASEGCHHHTNGYYQRDERSYPWAELSSLAFPIFDNIPEDDYNPPSAFPEASTDSMIPQPSSISYEGADGLQVQESQDENTSVPHWWSDWIQQLSILDSPCQTAEIPKSDPIKNIRSLDTGGARLDSAKSAPDATQSFSGIEVSTAYRKLTGSTSPSTSSSSPYSYRPFHDDNGYVHQPLSRHVRRASEEETRRAPRNYEPPKYKAYSQTQIPTISAHTRPSIIPGGDAALIQGGRSLSDGASSTRRGTWGWLAAPGSESHWGGKEGWGEG